MNKILITGASSGIGKVTSDYLMSFGFCVTALTRDQLDLNDLNKVKSFDLTSFDILINNAGHELGLGCRFDEISHDDFLSQMNVNLLAPMILSHNFITQNSSGLVINITSGIVDEYRINSVPYYTSKSALQKFCKSLREDMKENFRVVEIKPKRINTEFMLKNNAKQLNNNFLIEPIEVAKAVKFAIDNENISNITVQHPKR